MKTYQPSGNDSLLIINHKSSKKILIKNVVLLKGNINYTIFCLEYGKERVVVHSIKFFESHLEKMGFLRVHRSYMINPVHVKEYHPEQYLITMTNGEKASISRRRKHTLKRFVCT